MRQSICYLDGGSIYVQVTLGGNLIIEDCNFTDCQAYSNGGAAYISTSGTNSKTTIINSIFKNCTSQYVGGGFHLGLSNGGNIQLDRCEFFNCTSNHGVGGGIYLIITFNNQITFEIIDTYFHDCKSTESSSNFAGYGAGIFLIGDGDYTPALHYIDLRGMKFYNNKADRNGHTLYIVTSKVIDLCRYGIQGEYIKGNYSDGISDQNELMGIPRTPNQFYNLNINQIQSLQKPLENWWYQPKGLIWHLLNRNEGTIQGIDYPTCAEFDHPCLTIEYTIRAISFMKSESDYDAFIDEKRLGICEAGFDLTAPYQFSKTGSHTNIIKIMKQLYGTDQEMSGQAEIKIIKGSDESTIENGNQGWISAVDGLELGIFGIRIISDKSKLTIPIIYIQDQSSILQLNTITIFDINLTPSASSKGIVHIEVFNSLFLASNSLFEKINIEGSGGNVIRMISTYNKAITATITSCKFIDITAYKDSESRGGAAICARLEQNSQLEINGETEFNSCQMKTEGFGGAFCAQMIYGGLMIIDGECSFIKCTTIVGALSHGGGLYVDLQGEYSYVQLNGNITFDSCESTGSGGGLYASIYIGQSLIISETCQFTKCKSEKSGGGMFAYQSGMDCLVEISGEVSFNECSALIRGGGIYFESYNDPSIVISKVVCQRCSASLGGGIFIFISFSSSNVIEINDASFEECKAIEDKMNDIPPSGYGGGIFVGSQTSVTSYTKYLDLQHMKMNGNTADRGGQSMYVTTTFVIDWCRKGYAGQYVKGDYIEGTSNQNELQGIPINLMSFQSLTTESIQQQQKPLEYYWDYPLGQIWHILNKDFESLIGSDQTGCAEFEYPCLTIAYAIQQISIEKGSSADAIIPEKRIGIHQGGYDLTTPYQFSKSNSYTDCVKIMKQLYGTASVMEDQAELMIIKGSSGSAVENGYKGWISAIEGIQLRIYGVKIVTDLFNLLIPIIYIEGETSVLELNTVTLTGIDYISPSNPDDPNPERFIRGLIHIDVDDSIFIASGCLFKEININSGGNAIRIHNYDQKKIVATISECEFININVICDEEDLGGAAIYAIIGENGELTIKDQCVFDKCSVKNGLGGAIFSRIINSGDAAFINSQFVGCEAFNGGCIYTEINSNGILTIDGVTSFTRCIGTVEQEHCFAGGIYAILNSGGIMNIFGQCTFTQCTASVSGAIYARISDSSLFLIDCISTFTKCYASSSAGGIYALVYDANSKFILKGQLIFDTCTADFHVGGMLTSINNGAQIEISANILFNNCSCSALTAGGLQIDISQTTSNILLTGELTFENCSSQVYGGGFHFSATTSGYIELNKIICKNCSCSQGGGGLYAQVRSGGELVITGSCLFKNCSSSEGNGAGLNMLCTGTESTVRISGLLTFDQCTSFNQGGGAYLSSVDNGLIEIDMAIFKECNSSLGGGLYMDIDFTAESYIKIIDFTFQDCKAIKNELKTTPTGYGGGLFLTGNGDYDLSSEKLNLKGMKIFGNNADKAGIPLSGDSFIAKTTPEIQQKQKTLEYYWTYPLGQIWHVLNKYFASIIGNNQTECAAFDNPCFQIAYALEQISYEKGGTITSVIPEKKIGIHQGGYDMTAPIQFSKSNSYTDCVKIMKQLYGTSQVMSGLAEIKIIKGGDEPALENGHKGWISASGGIELKFYFIKFITDKSKLTIPIILIEDENTKLELDSVTFSDIILSPSNEPKGIIHIEVNDTELIISDCIFEDITIEGEGGSAIRIENDQENSFDATIEGTQFNNINSTGDESGQGGSAIYVQIREDCSLVIDDSCEFNDCVIESGNGGALYVDIDYSKNFQFKIKDATFRHNRALKHSSKDVPPSGYGGVIFLTGTGDYDVESEQIDLGGMKSDSNSADNGGNNIYIVMPQLEQFCQKDNGALIKGDYDDKESDLNDVEGISTDVASFISLTPELIEQEQKSLQYYWAVFASLKTAKVMIDFRNVDEPFIYQLVGNNMIAGINEFIWPPLDGTSDPIAVEDVPDSDQIASFSMKDKQILNYKQKQYGALISNDRRFFTGIDGIEGNVVQLEVEVIFDSEKEEGEDPGKETDQEQEQIIDEQQHSDSPIKSKFPWWIILVIVLIVVAVIITIGTCLLCYCCIWKKKNKEKDLDERLKYKEY
ncbi:MAG: hypothetical protein EZS28_005958 [Streblomastix strix]|uniref:Uncharacterized protein n=1 Tax=Streblomastix strix TaxID=222440 RepID=A0A5J4WU90_9EUKA|nr:MAG: hypothetical protein EZS28_005958 [Streblomastix strix]